MPPIPAPAPAAEPERSLASAESRRQKKVRDRFSMPREDYALIDTLKERAGSLELKARKSELLRAGLHALTQLNNDEFRALLDALPPVKKKRD